MSQYDNDGLCGVISPHTLFDGTRLCCRHPFGHEGEHSWVKALPNYQPPALNEIIERAHDGSPVAEAMLLQMMADLQKKLKEAQAAKKCPVCDKPLVGLVQEDGEIRFKCGDHFIDSYFPKP